MRFLLRLQVSLNELAGFSKRGASISAVACYGFDLLILVGQFFDFGREDARVQYD